MSLTIHEQELQRLQVIPQDVRSDADTLRAIIQDIVTRNRSTIPPALEGRALALATLALLSRGKKVS